VLRCHGLLTWIASAQENSGLKRSDVTAGAVNLKKNPPIREVVYTISPFELDIMSALWKEFPVRVLAS